MFQKGWNHQPGNHCRVWNKSFERIRTGQPLQPQLRPSFPMAWQAFITAWLSSVKSLRLRMFAVKRPWLVKIVCLYLQHDMYDMMLIMYTVHPFMAFYHAVIPVETWWNRWCKFSPKKLQLYGAVALRRLLLARLRCHERMHVRSLPFPQAPRRTIQIEP